MVGTWTFDAAARTITCVGGSLDAPATLNDAYNADITGTRTLKAATPSPFTASLDTAVAPAESLALPLSLIITNFSSAGTVQLTGKDAWGNAISETLNVTTNGTIVSTLYYSSIDTNGVVAAGGFDVEITQPRWGVVARYSVIDAQYVLTCRLDVGDGSTSTFFVALGNEITWDVRTSVSTIINVKNNAYARFGLALDETAKTTSYGCHITLVGNVGWGGNVVVDSGGQLYLYSTEIIFQAHNFNMYCWGQLWINGHVTRVWNSQFLGVVFNQSNGTDFYNVIDCNAVWPDGTQPNSNGFIHNPIGTTCTFDRIYAFDCYVAYTSDMGSSKTVKNLYSRNVSYVTFIFSAGGTSNMYFINPDVDAWTFYFISSAAGKVYRQYELDLTVTDPSCTPLDTAKYNTKVTLTKGSMTIELSTDANGAIVTQTLTHGYYQQATGNVEQDTGTWSLLVEADGYQPYTTECLITEKTHLHLSLRPQLSGTADPKDVRSGKTFYKDTADTKLTGSLVAPALFVDVASGKPVLNLNRNKPDNCLVLGL